MLKKFYDLNRMDLQVVIGPLTLLFRCYVAWVFFKSGLLKLDNWDSTLYLFESEYNVPLLPFEMAAIVAVIAELFLPAVLVLGIYTRFMALSLFVFNIVAVVSYPVLWAAGFWDHKLWGVMLLWIAVYGGGAVSFDARVIEAWLYKKKVA